MQSKGKFIKPKTLEQALETLAEGDHLLVSGGTDVMVRFHEGLDLNRDLLDISSLKELKTLEYDGEVLKIGAGCTHGELEDSPLVKEHAPMIGKACSLVGSTLVRNRGTIGGNVVNGSSCADTVPALLLMDADVNMESAGGKRTVPLKEMYLESGKFNMHKNEILTSFIVKPKKEFIWGLEKIGRRKSLAISRITLGIMMKTRGGVVEELGICTGAMLSRHQRLSRVEQQFRGTMIDEKAAEAMAERIAEEAVNIAGRRWSTEYKEHALKGLALSMIRELMQETGVNSNGN